MKGKQQISKRLALTMGILMLAFCCCNHSSSPNEANQKKIDSLFDALKKEKERKHFMLDSMKILRERDSVMNLLELERLKVTSKRISYHTDNESLTNVKLL